MTTRVQLGAYGAGTGRMLVSAGNGDLAGVDPADLVDLLAAAGFLVLRGFATDIETFAVTVKRLSSMVVADPAREFFGTVAQKVDAGLHGVGLHLENGNSPFRPDLNWFYCQRAARAGSQTTVCDGYRVYDQLSGPAREAFTGQEICYARNVAEPAWRALAVHLLGGVKSTAEVTIEDLMSFAPEPERTTVRDNGDGSVFYAHREPAVRLPTLFDTRPAWANSIFGPSYNYEAPRITFADGSPIPAPLLAEVRDVTAAVTEDIDWQDGDVVVIDNSRVMHGRREILDADRTIFNAQSYLDTSLRTGMPS